MGIMSGNPIKDPMHYGEVFATWSYLLAEKGMVALYQTFVNHTGDEELRKMLKEAIDLAKEEGEQVAELLKANGVALPPTPPERPMANLEDIPAGARLMDQEIGTLLSINISKGLVACSTIMGQSIREDIALMFGQFHLKKTQHGAKVLKLMKEKGWLISPPLHHHS